MPQKIITNSEIITLLGLGSSSEVIVDMWNQSATELICSLLDIADIATHSVVNERVRIIDSSVLNLSDFPVDASSVVLKTTFDKSTISGFSFEREPRMNRTLNVYNLDGTTSSCLPYNEVFASYTAGYKIQDEIEVKTIVDLVDKTFLIKKNGTQTTYTIKASGATGNQINIGVDAATTAAAIASALGGSIISGAKISLPLGSTVQLGTATTSQLGIVAADVPQTLKNCIGLIAGGGIAEKNKAGDVTSYTIGGKTVQFRNKTEADTVKMILDNWVSVYKKVNIQGI